MNDRSIENIDVELKESSGYGKKVYFNIDDMRKIFKRHNIGIKKMFESYDRPFSYGSWRLAIRTGYLSDKLWVYLYDYLIEKYDVILMKTFKV